MFPETTVLTLLSVIIFTFRPFPHTTITSVRRAQKRDYIHITEFKIHISYSEKHDSTLFYYYFYLSLLPNLDHIIAKGSTFSISSPFGVTKLQQQKTVTNVNGHAYSYPLPPPWRWGLNFNLNGIEIVIIHLSVLDNYGFDTIVSEYCY